MPFGLSTPLALSVTLIFTIIALAYSRRYVSTPLKIPPGPPSFTLLGHLGKIPDVNQEIVFHQWSKLYGDVIQLFIPGRSYIILGSLKSATDLLEKRSGIYSDRWPLVLFKLMGWLPSVVMMPYGKQFQKHRTLLQGELNKKICRSYYPIQQVGAENLLDSLLNKPEEYEDHLFKFTSSIVVKIAYGYDLEEDDPYIEISKKAMESLTICGPPGGTAVDFLPFLLNFPSWFPGTYYAYLARSYYKRTRLLFTHLFDKTENTAPPSFVSAHLKRLQSQGINDDTEMDDIRGVAGVMYTGAVETSMLLYLIFILLTKPEVQERAQNEIDNTVGRKRLPNPEDRVSLPYVEAILQELYRCNSPLPLGVPHRSLEDDIYNGMFIPKGSVVIANIYGINHDETVYSDPYTFNLGRYLTVEDAEPHPAAQFGFGRRICPGRYLADGSLWLAIACIVACFTVTYADDDRGHKVIPKEERMTGLTSRLKPFKCTITPRDEAARALMAELKKIR